MPGMLTLKFKTYSKTLSFMPKDFKKSFIWSG